MAQNLVSGAITPEQKAQIGQAIASIKAGLPMIITLQPEQKKGFVRVGDTYVPFIDDAHEVFTGHPEIMSGAFDKAEYERDYQLSKDLMPILVQLRELAESVEDTMFAARSDAMAGSLEVYASVQGNKDKIPGMDTSAAKLGGYFKKTRAAKAPPVATQ